MSWNNRVIRQRDTNGEWHYQIHECYYEKPGVPHMWTEEPVAPYGTTLTELHEHHALLAEAFKAPVLEVRGDKVVETEETL